MNLATSQSSTASSGPSAPASDDALGLTSAQATARLASVGRNVIAEKPRRPLVVQILLRFRNPLIILLLGASGIAGLTGDLRSFVVTLVMVALSVGLDFVQEHRADRAAERLRSSAVTRACVSVPTPQLVPGDVVALAAGDLVPADGRLVQARDLFVTGAADGGALSPLGPTLGFVRLPAAFYLALAAIVAVTW